MAGSVTELAKCPICAADWAYTGANGHQYSHLIGVEIRGGFDGVSIWRCPACGAQWDRFTGERVAAASRATTGEEAARGE